jgi:guanylate kinase
MPHQKLIVISAPSGSGKTTIARAVLQRHPALEFSVSATTRAKRPNEIDGRDYFFLTPEDFRQKIDAGLLVEWEEIYGNYYGTLKSEIDRTLAAGKSMVFDIDVKGALSIKRQYPAEAVLIFIRPPTVEILTERLRNRKTESPATLRTRLERVEMELEAGKKFDESIVNERLDKAIDDVEAIVCRHLGVAAAKQV